ncbi:MAG: D-alanyl-D-alanine carboxypeptidase, partial [Betaproteobacteria bacterium]|nr:D-alanyl-D-alanine carboxypeptidase [Betaproteobacteria bacterium]
MTKRFFCALMAMLMGSQVLAAKPGPSVNSSLWPEPSGLVSPSYMLIDLSTGQSLSSRKEDLEVAPAGLTSLMTAYITLSAIR